MEKERKLKRVGFNNFPASVDWDEISELEGIITDKKMVEFEDRKAECVIVSTDQGADYTVWVSAGLAPLTLIPVNSYVKIIFEGWQKNPATNRRFRKFSIFTDESVQLEEAPF